ncbi:MAG: hypothetical protein IK005_07650 [Paludibacteraceae bacterium]|nr:hypothetical protein [Paludibacteraceae bacterium]
MDDLEISQRCGESSNSVRLSLKDADKDWETVRVSLSGAEKGGYDRVQGEEPYDISYYINFDLPISLNDRGNEIEIQMRGKWYNGMDKESEIIREGYVVPLNVNVAFDGWTYGCSDEGNPLIEFNWHLGADQSSKKNVAYLCEWGTDELTHVSGNTRISGDVLSGEPFWINTSTRNLNDSMSYKIRYESLIPYEGTYSGYLKCVAESEKIEIPSYPQVSTFEADLEPSKRIVLNWDILVAPTSNYQEGGFLLSILKKNNSGEIISSTDTVIPYLPGTTKYAYEIVLGKMDKSVSFECDIERNSTEHGDCFTSAYAKHLVVRADEKDPCYPVDLTAEVSSDNSRITLKWDKEGYVWSEETKIILSKSNLTNSFVYEKVLSKSDFDSLTYVDTDVMACNAYEYKLIFKPGNGLEERILELDGEVSPSGCFEDSVYLTIQDGANGKTDMLIGECDSYVFKFIPDDDWSIASVFFNGENVTDDLSGNSYETPEIWDNSILSVTYKKNEKNAPTKYNPFLSVWASEGKVFLSNAQIDSKITITNVDGTIVYSGEVFSSEMVIETLGEGVFLVNVGGESFKVSL